MAEFARMNDDAWRPSPVNLSTQRLEPAPATASQMDPPPSYGRFPMQPARLQPRWSKGSKARHILDDWWAWEVISFTAAIGMFGLYLHLLRVYDEQPVSAWERSTALSTLFTTLPSAVSFIATIMKGALLFPVATAIGQLKWHYFRKPRHITDLEVMDSASRGLWGCVLLFLSRNVRHFVAFGCVIAIGTLVLGPFLQNTIHQQLRSNVESIPEDALIPVAMTYESWDWNDIQGEDPRFFAARPSMLASISSAWSYYFVPKDIQPSQVPAVCSSGLCAWHNVSTLRLRHQCHSANWTLNYHNGYPYASSEQANVTNLRDFGNGEKVFERLSLNPSREVPPMSSFASRRLDLPLLVHVGILGDYWGNGTAEAAECILYWSAVRYDEVRFNGTKVLEYNISEHAVSMYEVHPEQEQDITIASPFPCNFNRTQLGRDVSDACNLTVKWQAHRGLQNSLGPFLEGAVANFADTNPQDGTANNNSVTKFDDFLTNPLLWSWQYRIGDEGLEDSLLYVMNAYLGNMAFFITNNIRTQSTLYQLGTVSTQDVFYSIRKWYAVYPGALLLASILFVGITVWRTRHEPVWKNSQLPLLYHGLERPEEDVEQDLMSLAAMEQAAHGRKACLRNDGDGLGLKLRDVTTLIPLANVSRHTEYTSPATYHERGQYESTHEQAEFQQARRPAESGSNPDRWSG